MGCFLIVFVGWVFSVCLHEYGHAIVAYRGGDYTVEEKGYLSMNPIRYAHPVLSFALPMLFMVFGGIGLPGGAVYINRHLLKSRNWETGVSLAGPAMNLGLALILACLLRFFMVPNFPTHIATYALAFLLKLQLFSVLFNLIPIPPLDGFQAVEPWLAHEWREHLVPLSNYGILILFVVFTSVPGLSQFFWHCINTIVFALGIDPNLGFYGQELFRFWER